MENEKKELERPEIQDPHKKRYVVYTKRDTELMKTFIRFDNRVRHPRMGVNMGAGRSASSACACHIERYGDYR